MRPVIAFLLPFSVFVPVLSCAGSGPVDEELDQKSVSAESSPYFRDEGWPHLGRSPEPRLHVTAAQYLLAARQFELVSRSRSLGFLGDAPEPRPDDPQPGIVLQWGETGKDEQGRQQYSSTERYLLSINGVFDLRMENAVNEFQKRRFGQQYGQIGPTTWRALTTRPVFDGLAFEHMARVEIGRNAANKWDVMAIQYLLFQRGYLGFGEDREDVITGTYGEATETAVRLFQEEHCSSDHPGFVGAHTWYVLITGRHACGGGAGRLLELHDEGKIELWTSNFAWSVIASPWRNVYDAANGRPAARNKGGGGNPPGGSTELHPDMLSALVRLSEEKGLRYRVTSIAGAAHSPRSAHYRGSAVDIDRINGVVVSRHAAPGIRDLSDILMEYCREYGAWLVLGPENDPGVHGSHVHCQW